MNPAEKKPIQQRAATGRTITLTLSLPTIISGLIMLCAGFVGMFSLGILLGRGYDIEARIPHLERIMPQAAHPEQPRIIGHDDPPSPGQSSAQTSRGAGQETARTDAPSPAGHSGNTRNGSSSAKAAGAPQNPPPDPRNQVMDQGDLAYRDSLKQRQNPSAHKQATARQPSAKPKADPPIQGKAESAPQGRRPLAENASDKQDIFNYVYQVAAYKDAPMADKLTARLKAAGIRARTEKSLDKGQAWYRTVVDFTGSPDGTDTLREKLKGQGLNRLILKSKTPAG